MKPIQPTSCLTLYIARPLALLLFTLMRVDAQASGELELTAGALIVPGFSMLCAREPVRSSRSRVHHFSEADGQSPFT